MSIEIQVNEDIREYEPKFAGSFTFPQCISLAVAGVTSIIEGVLMFKSLGQGIVIPICFTATPILAVGFWKPHGFDFQEYAKVKINNSMQLQSRGYKNNNPLRELEKICIQYELQNNRKEKRFGFKKRRQ